MLRLITLIVLLIASVWLGVILTQHPGYLFILYSPWSVQMPLWFALIAGIIFFLLFYLLIDSLSRLQFLWYRTKNWFHLRREHKLYSKTQQGLSALIEGQFKKSEHLLMQGVQQSVDPLINYLGAAKAAHELQAYPRRDDYIKKAYEIAPKADLAIGLTQAELEFKQNQLDLALTTLTTLHKKYNAHPQVLKLLEKVYVRLGDYNQLKLLLPQMYKTNLLTKVEYQQLEQNIHIQLLQRASHDLSLLKKAWEQTPSYLKKNTDVMFTYYQAAKKFDNTLSLEDKFAFNKEAEATLRKYLKHEWNNDLATLYGTLDFPNLNRQLVIAGAWLKQYGPKQSLYFMLGNFCKDLKLWGRAKEYYEKALQEGKDANISQIYGQLLEDLGENDEALKVYKEGLNKCYTPKNP